MTVINVNPLSRTSINEAIDELRQYKETLQEFPKLFIDAAAEELNKILGEEVPWNALDTWTYRVVHEDKSSTAIFIFDGNVEFVEFGTGIVGKKNHDGINEDWLSKLPPPYTAYNEGPMIHHFEDEDKDFWTYKDQYGVHVTHGQPANPFIYRSVMELLQKRAEIGKKVFAENNLGHRYALWR